MVGFSKMSNGKQRGKKTQRGHIENPAELGGLVWTCIDYIVIYKVICIYIYIYMYIYIYIYSRNTHIFLATGSSHPPAAVKAPQKLQMV